MLQQNSGQGRKETAGREQPGSTGRPFPLVDFIARWRHGPANTGKNNGTGSEDMYLDETPSSPLLPGGYRDRLSSPPEESISRTHGENESEVFVPYPAPAAFLARAQDRSSKNGNNHHCDESVVTIRQIYGEETKDNDNDYENDDDDDDVQSIKSYDGQRITSYDNRSLPHDSNHDQGEVEHRQAEQIICEPNNMLSNFFTDAGNFISDQRAKLQGDTSRTRLKESITEMKLLRWDFYNSLHTKLRPLN